MSGIDVTKEPKEPSIHVCVSCMNTVVQTFTHLQERIAQLGRDKEDLQRKLKNLYEEHKKQKRVMNAEIIALVSKLAELKKNS